MLPNVWIIEWSSLIRLVLLSSNIISYVKLAVVKQDKGQLKVIQPYSCNTYIFGDNQPPSVYKCQQCNYETDKYSFLIKHSKIHKGWFSWSSLFLPLPVENLPNLINKSWVFSELKLWLEALLRFRWLHSSQLSAILWRSTTVLVSRTVCWSVKWPASS